MGSQEDEANIKYPELIHASLEDDIADAGLLRGPRYPAQIPPEILCEIFHYYIRPSRHSVWPISQVCRESHLNAPPFGTRHMLRLVLHDFRMNTEVVFIWIGSA